MFKKTLFIIIILLIGGLFTNGIISFFQSQNTADEFEIKNNQNIILDKTNALPTTTTQEKNKTSILKNVSALIKNPIIETYESLTGDDSHPPEEQNDDTIDTTKTALENYFITSSAIDFPESELITQAITLQKQGQSQALETIISILKEKNQELYAITPPFEAQEIHKNSLWIGNKFIEILEKVLKTNDENKILEILQNPEMQEAQDMTNKTKKDIEMLINEYKLDVKI